MRVREFISEAGCAVLVVACGVGPDAGDGTSVAASGDATASATSETSTSVASATSGASDASSSAETIASASGSSGSADTTETTSAGATGPELCRTAVTEADCDAADDECHWAQAYRVVDLATCTLEPASDLQCWARYVEPQNCAEGRPAACVPLDVAPRYREVDGALQLLDYACGVGPENLESDPPGWEICGGDEFRPVPPVCYCMCGGPLPGG